MPTTSVNFGPFGEVGMAASYADSMRAIGLHPLPPAATYDAFATAGSAPRMVRVRMDMARFAQVNQAKSKWAFLDNLTEVPQVCR